MLVLSRKVNEIIKIGDNVVVTVLSVKGGTIRLGIDAPKDVSILRGELTDAADFVPKSTVSVQ